MKQTHYKLSSFSPNGGTFWQFALIPNVILYKNKIERVSAYTIEWLFWSFSIIKKDPRHGQEIVFEI
jgi:hypothetical protein